MKMIFNLFKKIIDIFDILSNSKFSLILLFLLNIGAGLMVVFEVQALTTIVNKVSSLTISDFEANSFLLELLPLASVFVAVILLRSLVGPIVGWISTKLNEEISEDLKRKILEKNTKIKPSEFDSPTFYNKQERVNRLINGGIVQAILAVGTLLMIVIELLIIILLFAKVSVIMSAFILIFILPVSYQLSKAYSNFIMVNYKHSASRREKSYWQSLSTDKTYAAELRLNNLGRYFLNGWNKVNHQLMNELKHERLKLGISTFKGQSLFLLFIGIVLSVTLYKGVNGQISIGLIVSTIYLLNRFENILNQLLNSVEVIIPFFHEIQYVPDFFNIPEDHNTGVDVTNFKYLELNHVEFTYPGQTHPSIKGLSLKIKQGERIAIVGENGSGKTSLAKLLLGIYEPSHGIFSVNSYHVNDMNILSWRKICGAMFQDFHRYKMTVKENIIGMPITIPDNRSCIIKASENAGIHQRISSLPNDYDTLLGKGYENAVDLSGGEWQKIASARMYYQNAQFLILDEPAAALDPHAEHELYETFNELAKDKTIIFISHRLGSTKLADRIIHLEEGKIIEEGTHEELMSQKGKYSIMYLNQAKWYSEREDIY